MAGIGTRAKLGRLLRYTVGGVLILLMLVDLRLGLQWYWILIGFIVALLFILGRRRIFRAGVSRTTEEVICRYIPWYEGSAYFVVLGLPLFAIAMIAAGHHPGNPVWLRWAGIILLVLMPVMVFSVVSMWRRCVLRITPSALIVSLAASKGGPTETPRERVLSITPAMIPNSVSGAKSLQVEIAYTTADSIATQTLLLGLQLTVEPADLLNALVAWREAAGDDPEELFDRVEALLRGRSMAGA